MSEMTLTPEVISAFRQRYVALFGPVTGDDPLYESISAGRQHQGMEHWLPLFHDRLVPLFDYLPGARVTLDPLVDDARTRRLEQIADHYDARAQALERKAFGAPPYHPIPPKSMFLTEADWQQALSSRQVIAIDPFEHPEAPGVVSFGGRQGRTFAAERQTEGVTVFDAVVAHAKRLRGEAKRVIVACWSNGSRERLATLLSELRRRAARATRRDRHGHPAARDRLRGAGPGRDRRAGHSRRPAGAQVARQARQRRSH
jgi:transcription-repair coupling factor (superfamily II helicase)